MTRSIRSLLLVLVVALLGMPALAAVPASDHIIVVVLENHSFSSAWNSMPWLRSVAKNHGYVKYYYANTHPSIGNYFMMTTGHIITNNDGYTGTVTANNLARQLITAGKTWKVYAESLPYAGYVGGDRYPYVKHHNPFAYFSDVRNSSQKYYIVPFSQFDDDLASGHLPNFSFIVPNMFHDAHDGSLAAADSWLKSNIAPVLSTYEFQHDGILVITFDESFTFDTAHGGGRVLTVLTGPGVGPAEVANYYYYQHQSLLRTIAIAFGLPQIGEAANTRSLGELF
jgi:hypothetical protein